ncbi:MAG: adenylate/guanylate cyclase domain-containing protein [Chloroflexota bacterium]
MSDLPSTLPSLPAGAPGRLLLIDDNRVMRLLLAHALELQGHSVTGVENGRRGLELLRAGCFDLVLLDIEMPEMDGFQVLEAITADPALRYIPVVMISAVSDIASVARCIQMGAEDYLFKPPNPVLLQARICSSLEKKRLRDAQRELVRKFTASEAAEDLLARGISLDGMLIEATVLFANIQGFAGLAAGQPPAVTIQLLNEYDLLMFDAIQQYGGSISQIMGDGIMALFGAPAPLVDQAQCAVLCGLEMLDLAGQFNQQRAAQGQTPIQLGIGIATGQMVSGYTGTEQRAIYTCIGDTVNQAARLRAYTETAGRALLIDESTRRSLDAALPVEACGAVTLKGKRHPVNVFHVFNGPIRGGWR